MNTNKMNSIRIRRAKRTFLGKAVCRLMGEETGAIMMEYVVVAVMVAAAVAAGVWYFGRGVFDGFTEADMATRGMVTDAEAHRVQSNTDRPTQGAAADTSNKTFIDTTHGGNATAPAN